MKNIKFLVRICTLILSNFILCSGQQAYKNLTIDFSKSLGKIKLLHGINGGPFSTGLHANLISYHAEAGFPQTRLHDANWPNPGAVDIPTIFPVFDADADDPKYYNFSKTDDYLAPIIKNKSEIIYRLGTSIEHHTQYFIHPPKDYQKWAKICTNIIRHYNDGWANGFHYNIKYWEIWNEPEGKLMWLGTQQQYLELYKTAAKAIKSYNSSLKVGGPAAISIKSELIKPFLTYCRDQSLPLDFLSWHIYTINPLDIVRDVKLARSILDEYGFKTTENHLNEWHFIPDGNALGWGLTNLSKWTLVRPAYERTVGPEGASFCATILMLLQDQPIDIANFYCADVGNPYSMFDSFGVPSKTYYVFKAFNELSKLPNRVACEGLLQDSTSALCASISDDKKVAIFMESNFSSRQIAQSVKLKSFPGKGKINVEILFVDKNRSLGKPVKETISDNKPLLLNLPPHSVCLVRLNRS